MWNIKNQYTNEPISRNKENKSRTEETLSSFVNNFYKDVKEPIIIDREKMWGTPANLALLKEYITPTPKIIFTVRNILDIISSFVKMDADYIKRNAATSESFFLNYRSLKDSVAEYLMFTNGDIDKALLSLASAFYPENKGIFHLVEYDDLLSKPDETMSSIYEFLELPEYKHNFNHIKKVELDDDESVGLPKDMHNVRPSLSKSTTDTDILSDYIKHKYSNMEFWRDGSLMKVRGKDF